MEKKERSTVGILEVVLGILAVSVIFSLFKGDSGKVLTNKGKLYMGDDSKMAELDKEIETLKNQQDSHKNTIDILI
ncbi:MAG: hypothetical protein ACK5U7_05835 [Bacteroidota bacterium]|jgi:hypothetical protein